MTDDPELARDWDRFGWAFESVRRHLLDRIGATEPHQADERDALYYTLHALSQVKREIVFAIQRGRLAAQEVSDE
jgi:hypothetical protein